MSFDKFSYYNENPYEKYFKKDNTDKPIKNPNVPIDTNFSNRISPQTTEAASAAAAAPSRSNQELRSTPVPSNEINDYRNQIISLLTSQQNMQTIKVTLYQALENQNNAAVVRQQQNSFLSKNPFGNLFQRTLRKKAGSPAQPVASELRKWQDLIQRATSDSPGEIVARDLMEGRISQAKYDQIMRDEWLVKPPLTGICTGLALDFIIALETGRAQNRDVAPSLRMQPSSTARHFERLLIPIVLRIAKESGVDPADLDTSRYGKRIYDEMIQVVREKTGLEGRLTMLNTNLNAIESAAHLGGGHQLLLLEDPQGGVTANHTVYFNPEKRIIADGADGKVIHVPRDVDFHQFFSYYIKETYRNTYSSFSVVSVDPGRKVPTVPGFLEQNALKLKILAMTMLSAVT